MKKVLILDTSILCVWLKVPGKETCGPDRSRWTYETVKRKIDAETEAGTTMILPLASIIETGNHIAQAHGDRHQVVNAFVEHIDNALDGRIPWAAFTEQSRLIGKEALKQTLSVWKESAVAGQSLGDALIVDVAKYYASYGVPVEIFTGDEGLKAYEPLVKSSIVPRRKR